MRRELSRTNLLLSKVQEMGNITIRYSEKGSNMEELHKQIMQFKNWLKCTHQKCASEYLFAYINEYRFNKRNMRKWLFNDIIGRMMHQFPHPYQYLKIRCVYST